MSRWLKEGRKNPLVVEMSSCFWWWLFTKWYISYSGCPSSLYPLFLSFHDLFGFHGQVYKKHLQLQLVFWRKCPRTEFRSFLLLRQLVGDQRLWLEGQSCFLLVPSAHRLHLLPFLSVIRWRSKYSRQKAIKIVVTQINCEQMSHRIHSPVLCTSRCLQKILHYSQRTLRGTLLLSSYIDHA